MITEMEGKICFVVEEPGFSPDALRLIAEGLAQKEIWRLKSSQTGPSTSTVAVIWPKKDGNGTPIEYELELACFRTQDKGNKNTCIILEAWRLLGEGGPRIYPIAPWSSKAVLSDIFAILEWVFVPDWQIAVDTIHISGKVSGHDGKEVQDESQSKNIDLVARARELISSDKKTYACQIILDELDRYPLRCQEDEQLWLALSDAFNQPEYIARCLSLVLKLNPNNQQASARLGNLESIAGTQAKRDLIEMLRKRILTEPDNGDLHFALAILLLSYYPLFMTIGDEKSTYWIETISQEMRPTWRILAFSNEVLQEAKDELITALSHGLSNNLKSAKAKILILNLTSAESNFSNEEYSAIVKKESKSITRRPNALKMILLKEITSDLKKHLARYPDDVHALKILRAIYDASGNEKELWDLELVIRRVENTGITENQVTQNSFIPNENSRINNGLGLEEQVRGLLQAMGLSAATTKASGDGGIDIIAFSSSAIFSGKYIVQCKDWVNPVGEPALRDLFGVIISEGANKGILITTGSFTKAAARFAEGKPIELINGVTLRGLLRKYKLSPDV
jgi:hypothetical protein